MEKVIIVGGGIAGLSCLNALLDRGVSALLVEGNTIGTEKMCGEFLAPAAVNVLEKWGIGPIQPIKQANFYAKNKKFTLHFPRFAGAYARSSAELQLAQRALKNGGRILENTSITQFTPATKQSPYLFYLSSGETIEANTAIFATGKLPQLGNKSTSLPYVGLKTHFQQVVNPETLLMYSVPGAYFGIVPLSATTSNFACLAKRDAVEKIGSGQKFFHTLIKNNQTLQQIFAQVEVKESELLTAQVPSFCLKTIPLWPKTFWIGDALASLHPAIGHGFAHSIYTAVMAADFYLQNDPQGYLQMTKPFIKSKLQISKPLHLLLQTPTIGKYALSLLNMNAWISSLFLQKLGYD